MRTPFQAPLLSQGFSAKGSTALPTCPHTISGILYSVLKVDFVDVSKIEIDVDAISNHLIPKLIIYVLQEILCSS
jgi:hypothetical protein